MKVQVKTIASQPSWILRNKEVELAVTQLGGHMAPVVFYRSSKAPVQPYYLNPWHNEKAEIDLPVLAPLRGDFFCMPFGDNEEVYRDKKFDLHGEPASRKWRFESLETGKISSLTLSMKTKGLPGKITKTLSIIDGHNVVYIQHLLDGFSGSTPLGHHPNLAMPQSQGSVHISTSAIKFGMTNPTEPGRSDEGEYFSAMVNKRFTSLSKVPLIWSESRYGDFSCFPARCGFTDLIAVFHKPTPNRPAWTTATFEDKSFMWFSLKDAQVLPTMLMWISNRGRHGSPRNGRNCCLGLEDVCGYFAKGIALSVKANPLSRQGIPTAIRLTPKRTTSINHIQGTVKLSRGFKKVRSAKFAAGKVTFTSTTGERVAAKVNTDFLFTGKLE